MTVLSQLTSMHEHRPSTEVIMNKSVTPIVYVFETRNSLDQNTIELTTVHKILEIPPFIFVFIHNISLYLCVRC